MAKIHRALTEAETGVTHWMFFCPGCQSVHGFKTPAWTYDGNLETPTVQPSLLVTESDPDTQEVKRRCHSFVTNGKIQFRDDCWHDLKGQTVDLPEWDLNG